MKNYKLYNWAIEHYKCDGLEPRNCFWNKVMNIIVRISNVNAFDIKG